MFKNLKPRVRSLAMALPNSLYCFLLVLEARVRFGQHVRFGSTQHGFIVSDKAQKNDPNNGLRLEFARKTRCSLYLHGVRNRVETLGKIYYLDLVELRPNDVVIDVGANVGEFSVACQLREPSIQIIAIEPIRREAICCDSNVFTGRPNTVQSVLYSSSTNMKFLDENNSGDSSLFPAGYSENAPTVMTTTLDNVLRERGVGSIRLLKLEAEGAEPEVLQGATSALTRIDYVSADVGPERGPDGERTRDFVEKFLIDSGFRFVVDSSLHSGTRETVLFERIILGERKSDFDDCSF